MSFTTPKRNIDIHHSEYVTDLLLLYEHLMGRYSFNYNIASIKILYGQNLDKKQIDRSTNHPVFGDSLKQIDLNSTLRQELFSTLMRMVEMIDDQTTLEMIHLMVYCLDSDDESDDPPRSVAIQQQSDRLIYHDIEIKNGEQILKKNEFAKDIEREIKTGQYHYLRGILPSEMLTMNNRFILLDCFRSVLQQEAGMKPRAGGKALRVQLRG